MSEEYPSLEICIQFSDDGKHIRKWSRIPFDGGTNYYSHPAQEYICKCGQRVEPHKCPDSMEF